MGEGQTLAGHTTSDLDQLSQQHKYLDMRGEIRRIHKLQQLLPLYRVKTHSTLAPDIALTRNPEYLLSHPARSREDTTDAGWRVSVNLEVHLYIYDRFNLAILNNLSRIVY